MVIDQVPAIHCEIDAKVAGQRVSLRGIISTQAEGTGKYKLVVSKASRGGTSTVSQSGEFNTVVKEPTYVGSVILDYESATHYTAKLSILFRDQTYSCDFVR